MLELERRLRDAMPAIERWFRAHWQEHTPNRFYSDGVLARPALAAAAALEIERTAQRLPPPAAAIGG